MARGHEEVLTSQAGRRRGTPRETLTTSSLVAAMSAEELRLTTKFLSKSVWRRQTVRLPQLLGRQIMPSILLGSSLLLGFASPFYRW